jgi:guanidinobutyrase
MRWRAPIAGLLGFAVSAAMYACIRSEAAQPPAAQPSSQSQPTARPANQPAQTPGRGQAPATPAGQTGRGRQGPTKYVIQRPEDPIIHLNPDADLTAFVRPRDMSKDPKREPGPVPVPPGIPTFFRAPIAFTPEDLKAGKVDVAFIGAPLDMGSGMRGAGWGPRGLRAWDPRPYGIGSGGGGSAVPTPTSGPSGGAIVSGVASNPSATSPPINSGRSPNMHVMLDPFAVLNVVDYGDAPIDNMSTERTLEPVRAKVREIAATGTIPFIVGGDHSLEYADVAGLADVHGKGKIGVIHFDSHFDASPASAHLISHGQPVRRVVEEGHVLGKNYIQVGLRGYYPNEEGFRWMRQQGFRYHTMAEVDRDGWDAVMKRVITEALDGPEKLHLSFDIDVIDPAYAPGTGTPEPGGPTPREMFPLVRNLCAQKNVIGMDLVEVAPRLDPGYVTLLVANRILKECLTGIAMRRRGITERNYLSPLVVDWRP